MKVHEMQMDQIEWSSYLIGFRTNVFIEADPDMSKDDLIIMQETVNHKAKKTGRNIAFRIIGIDMSVGVYEDMVIWNVELKRLKQYIYPSNEGLMSIANAGD